MTSVHVETIGDNDGFKLNREKNVLCVQKKKKEKIVLMGIQRAKTLLQNTKEISIMLFFFLLTCE